MKGHSIPRLMLSVCFHSQNHATLHCVKSSKKTPLTVRGCSAELHKALKESADANRRSLNGEALTWLERAQGNARVVTSTELADALERAQKLLTPKQHRQIARHIQAARKKMAHEHLH